MAPVIPLLVASIIVLLIGGWVRAAGSAVSLLPRADAHHDAAEGRRGARMVANLLDDRARIPPAVGMVASTLLVLATLLGAVAVHRQWSGGAQVGFLVLVAVVVIVLGDVLARLLGRSRPQAVAYNSGPLLVAAVRLGGWTAERVVEENGDGVASEEAEDEDELALINSVLEFSETIVREVMVPRLDMITMDVDAGKNELAGAAIEHGFSRFPVSDGDEIVGVFLVKDLLPAMLAGVDGATARRLMRPAYFVPEVKQIADLLTEMRATKNHMAIAVDEFGEIAGLVTIEDLLEELVGEIADETDEDEIWVEPISEGHWKVDARLDVEDLESLVGLDLPEGDWDTVAGLVLGLAERVPEPDETFEAGDVELTVARMQGRRVAEVIVTRTRSAAGHDRR